MPTLTAARSERRYFFDEPFDNESFGNDSDNDAVVVDQTHNPLHELLDSEPAPARASLATVIALFLTLALLQVGMSALIVTTFDLSGFRIALVYVIAAPALLYAIIAAWDHRQLRATGHPSPTPWGWALLFPPVYLILRWATATNGGQDRVRTVFGWALAQAVVTLSLIVLIVVGVVASAAPSADAAATSSAPVATVTADDSEFVLTSTSIERAVVDIWAASGDTGTVSCPDGFSTDPGTVITCQGILEDETLSFTVVVTQPLDGQRPWEFSSWTSGR